MNIKKIYFDMDGVLADFNRGVLELCNIRLGPYDEQTEEQDDEMWAAIRKIDHFYDKLSPMPGGLTLFRAVYEKYQDRCEILTGIPKEKRGIVTAGEDKIAWAHRVLTPHIVVNVVYAEDKKNLCTGPDCVLIDDLKRNIRMWEDCGGTGILCQSPARAMELLQSKGII